MLRQGSCDLLLLWRQDTVLSLLSEMTWAGGSATRILSTSY
jgi:hypothetical protein